MAAVNVTARDRDRFARARARGQARAQDPSGVVDAVYDAGRDTVNLTFRSGGSMTIPRRILQRTSSLIRAAFLRPTPRTSVNVSSSAATTRSMEPN